MHHKTSTTPLVALLFGCCACQYERIPPGPKYEVADTAIELVDIDDDGFTASEDCDDYNSQANPARLERCNGLDDDCDGLIDEDDAVDALTWFADADGDGYGDAESPTNACESPAGSVADESDCDDADPTTYPGATETCNDGVSNDCNMAPEDALANCAPLGNWTAPEADVTFLIGTSGDMTGRSVGPVGDVNGDGLDDLVVGAPLGLSDGLSTGCAYLLLGSAAWSRTVPATVELGAADATYCGATTGDGTGFSSSPVGDIDADGFDDFAVGANAADTNGLDSGSTFIVFGGAAPPATATLPGYGQSIELMGDSVGAFSGRSVHIAGDMDGDTLADIVIGASLSGAAYSMAGSAYIVSGAELAGLSMEPTALAEVGVRHDGVAADDHAGFATAGVGDTNGDGLDDVMVGAWLNDAGATDAGAAYLLLGGESTDDASLMDASVTFLGDADGAAFGISVFGPGDVNGDGLTEVAIGAWHARGESDDSGAVLMFSGGSLVDGATLPASYAEVHFAGEGTGDSAGYAIGGGGDLDGDSQPDLVIGAYGDGLVDVPSAGAVYILLSSGALADSVGVFPLRDSDGTFSGTQECASLGVSVALVPDVNADGFDDLFMGASGMGPDGDCTTGESLGTAYLFLGRGL